MADDLEFRPVPAGTGDAAELVAAMVAEMAELYDGLNTLRRPRPGGAGHAQSRPGRTRPA